MAGFEDIISGLQGRLSAFTANMPQMGGFSPGGGPAGGFSPGGGPAGGFSPAASPQGQQWHVGGGDMPGFSVGATGPGGGFNVGGGASGGFAVGSVSGGFSPGAVPRPAPVSSGGGGGGVWDYTGPATADDNKTLSSDKVNAYISSYEQRSGGKSPLAGLGAQIIEIANRYGISAPLLLGIATKESGLGTNVGAGNIFGITDPSRDGGLGGQRAFQSFSGALAEVEAAAKMLAGDTYRGKSAAEQIGSWYVGPQEFAAHGLQATDRAGNGTVQDYLDGIAAIYQALGVTFQPSQSGVPTGGGAGDLAKINAPWARVAQQYLGVGYTNGGIRNTGNPRDGMDCSSFTGYALGLPGNLWNAQAQYDNTNRVNAQQAQAGDLVFFQGTTSGDPSARPVTHVGIYIGNGRMVHTGGDGGVMVVDLNSQYWQSHLYGFGRVRR